MAQSVLEIGPLGDDALEAAAQFHSEWLPKVRVALAARPGNLVLMFEPLDYRHRKWCLAAVQELALGAVPVRVNAVAGSGDGLAETLAYLDSAPGVTGQLLDLHEGLG